MKFSLGNVIRYGLAWVTLALALLPAGARASLLGDSVTGCVNTAASGISTTPDAGCASLGTHTIVDPGVEFVLSAIRSVDFGADTVTLIYTNALQVLPDLWVFTDIDLPGVIDSLTLVGTDPVGIQTAFTDHAIGLLVPDVCGVTACNFNVTFRFNAPVPGTLALLGLGLAGLAGVRRRAP